MTSVLLLVFLQNHKRILLVSLPPPKRRATLNKNARPILGADPGATRRSIGDSDPRRDAMQRRSAGPDGDAVGASKKLEASFRSKWVELVRRTGKKRRIWGFLRGPHNLCTRHANIYQQLTLEGKI